MSKYECSMGDPFDMLAEESAELIQELMKRRRFGDAGMALYEGTKPRENIIQELGDFLAVVDIIYTKGYFHKEELARAKANKVAKLKERFTDYPAVVEELWK